MAEWFWAGERVRSIMDWSSAWRLALTLTTDSPPLTFFCFHFPFLHFSQPYIFIRKLFIHPHFSIASADGAGLD